MNLASTVTFRWMTPGGELWDCEVKYSGPEWDATVDEIFAWDDRGHELPDDVVAYYGKEICEKAGEFSRSE